ncbi:MAG: hypothetical protein CL565_06590 [Alphaproteobacteria bacterium]|mgnify:CR=1 FL=1|nr:hypothetical protein [Alphaproteobacteria bacterium]
MLDVSWTEIVFILLVAILVIGPKELPQLMYGIGKFFRRIQYMKYALSNQFDDFMQETELQKEEQKRYGTGSTGRFPEENFFEEEKEQDEIEMELSFLRDLRKDTKGSDE